MTNLGRVEVQGALDAGRETGKDDPGVSLEALGSSVNEGNDRTLIKGSIFLVR